MNDTRSSRVTSSLTPGRPSLVHALAARRRHRSRRQQACALGGILAVPRCCWPLIKNASIPMSDQSADLSQFPITRKWPAAHPDRLQLYSLPTPNGVKVSIMLEEIGLPYEVHLVSFQTDDQLSPEFLSLNPNNKIPAILDPNGPGGKPLPLFESGAILWYLAEKTGKLLPADPAARYETLQWVMFQMGGVGPMFGQLGFFHKFAGKDIADKRPLERYVNESKRLLGVLDAHLADRQWIMGDEYTIADIATFPWIRNLVGFYDAGELVDFAQFTHVQRVLAAFVARPAVVRGLDIPKRPA
jgi:GST-like protein